jgi:hypothetical protein
MERYIELIEPFDQNGNAPDSVMATSPNGDWVLYSEAQAEIERLQAEVERLKVGHRRYEILRRLNVVQFQALYTKALQSPIPFDELVDMLGESK